MNFSLILEWDNARLSELARARRMLDCLPQQLSEAADIATASEILVMYDPESVEVKLIESVVSEHLGHGSLKKLVRVVPAPGLDYYDLKDRGAALAQGDVLVFLDSDVIPEPGWLRALLEPMQYQDVSVVCGNTYISLDGLYSKAFALFWFFPLRDTGTELRPATSFFANSYAIRRDLMRANPYPVTGQYRGRCAYLSKSLRDKGITIWYQPAARLEHPPPNGLRHFVSRAAYDGYDMLVRAQKEPHYEHSLKHCYWHFRSALSAAWKSIRHGRASVGLRRAEVPLAMLIATTFHFIGTLVVTLSLFAPRQVRRRLAV